MSSNIKRAATVAAIVSTLVTSGVSVATDAAASTTTLGSKALGVAKKQLGKPYKWGAAGPHKFDCSGLTLYSYKKAGKRLTYKYKGKTYTARTAQQQYNATTYIAYKDRKPGDLVFFTYRGNTHHVGIYIGMVNHRSTMVAASYHHVGATYKDIRKEVIYSKYWSSNKISFGRVK